MAFRPLEEVLGPITLPIKGVDYTLPAVSMEDGLRLHKILAGEDQEAHWQDLFDILLGDVKAQLDDAGTDASTIDRVFFTALADFQTGRDAAEKVWENGIPKEWVAVLSKAVELAQTTPQAEASTTKPPASGNGTNGPKRKTATGTRGRKSSTTSP